MPEIIKESLTLGKMLKNLLLNQRSRRPKLEVKETESFGQGNITQQVMLFRQLLRKEAHLDRGLQRELLPGRDTYTGSHSALTCFILVDFSIIFKLQTHSC